MIFLYKYSKLEDQFGTQDVRFVVSDDYELLFKTDAELAVIEAAEPGSVIEADIYELESVKYDLNTSEGSFAINEVNFGINSVSCDTTDKLKALYFALDSADLNNTRFCAIFFGNNPITDNLVFTGKVVAKFSASDLIHSGTGYNVAINPERNYKFTALSFDVTQLERCKHTSNIVSDFGVPVDNVYDRISASNYSKVLAISDFELSHITSDATVQNDHIYNCQTANLYDVIELFLNEAEDILAELLGTTLTFTLQSSSLGIKTYPLSYEEDDSAAADILARKWAVKTVNIESNAYELELKLIDTVGTDTDKSPVYIHFGLITSDLLLSEEAVNAGAAFDFMQLDNVAELLFEIAKSFACYVIIEYTSTNAINVTFKPLSELTDTSLTYLVGADQADIDTTSVLTKEPNKFYAQGSAYTTDGVNQAMNEERGSTIFEASEELIDLKTQIEYDKNKKNITTERLLLSTGASIHKIRSVNRTGNNYEVNIPFNILIYGNTTYPISIGLLNFPYNISSKYLQEQVVTNIFVESLPMRSEQVSRITAAYSATKKVLRPAHKITAKIDNDNEIFETLSDYVSAKQARDRQYYETEYSLTVPYWNGFSLTEGSSVGATWKNAKIGAKFKFSESVQRYQLKKQIVEISGAEVPAQITYVVETASAHGLSIGDDVIITGVVPEILNGLHSIVYVADSTHFTIEITAGTYPRLDTTPFTITKAGMYYAEYKVWESYTAEVEYTAISVERFLNEPKTKLKLHNVSRFAFGFYDGGVNVVAGLVLDTEGTEAEIIDAPVYEEGEVDVGETIVEGDVVQMLSTGKVIKARSDKTYEARTIGIATTDAIAGETLSIQTAGKFTSSNYNFTDLDNPQVYARTVSSGVNVTESILDQINMNEDMLIIAGQKIDSTSLYIEITENSFYSS